VTELPALFCLQFILCEIFEIELIEMREIAVPAPDGEVTRAYDEVVRTGHVTVPAGGILHKLPDRVFSDPGEDARIINILTPGHKDPGSPAVVAGYLRLVRHCLDDLVSNFFTMVAVSAVSGENKPGAHERYLMRTGSLTCCPPVSHDPDSGVCCVFANRFP
jgi:hypothetical protein